MKQCGADAYAWHKFSSLDEAKVACTADKQCAGIYDPGCSPYHWGYAFCPKGYKEVISSISCLYVKFGRYTLYITTNHCLNKHFHYNIIIPE